MKLLSTILLATMLFFTTDVVAQKVVTRCSIPAVQVQVCPFPIMYGYQTYGCQYPLNCCQYPVIYGYQFYGYRGPMRYGYQFGYGRGYRGGRGPMMNGQGRGWGKYR